jgi:PAS domain S-box-containing protein
MIVAQTTDAVIATDLHGVICVWNGGAERVFGHAAASACGSHLDLIIPDTLRKAHWAGFDQAIATGVLKYEGQVMVTRSVHQDGRKLYVEMTFNLLRDAAALVVGVLAIARDCTQHFEEERALRTRLRMLEQSGGQLGAEW